MHASHSAVVILTQIIYIDLCAPLVLAYQIDWITYSAVKLQESAFDSFTFSNPASLV